MPPLESSLLPKYGDVQAILIRKVRTADSDDGQGDVYIDYVLA